MNTRAIILFAAIIASIAPSTYTQDPDTTQSPKKTRRAHFRAKNAPKKVKKQGPPAKRFDDGKSSGSVHATYMHMNYEELETELEKLIADKYYDVAIKYIERMIAITTETEEHKTPALLLKVADILYLKQDYEKAWKPYAQWEQKYPGAMQKMDLPDSPYQAEYALFRAIECSKQCLQDLDRDQTQTHATIELTDRFLKKRSVFKTYLKQVEEIRTLCYEKLIASDLNICTFYRQQGNDAIVHTRLALLEEEYGTAFPATKNLVVAYRSTHYPDSLSGAEKQDTLIVESKPTKTHAADRF